MLNSAFRSALCVLGHNMECFVNAVRGPGKGQVGKSYKEYFSKQWSGKHVFGEMTNAQNTSVRLK